MNIEFKTLKNLKYQICKLYDKDVDVQIVAENIVENILVTATFRYPGECISHVDIEYPETWWQHFKKDMFPKFLLKRFPVKMTKRKIDQYYVYPNIHSPKDVFEIRKYPEINTPYEN